MNLTFFISRRYLFAKKSHNVINIISAISALGMAIGTAALIIIMSIYNGFDVLVRSMMGAIEPDIMITPSKGKTFVPEGDVYDMIYGKDEVASMCCVLQENVFADYNGQQSIIKVKGVDNIYEEESPLKHYIRDGKFALHRGDVPLCCVGAGIAHRLGVNPRFTSPLSLYFPTRTRSISISSPASSIKSANVYPSGIFSVNGDTDNEYVIVPIETMRKLTEYDDEVSAVEIRLKDGVSAKTAESLRREIAGAIGGGFKVSDRFMQNTSLYKMMKYEKASIFLILFFIIIIIAFNVFSSLSLLIIEKNDDIQTFRSMGATDKVIRGFFILEGWLISLCGLAAGLVAGVGFALLQQHFGFIKMPGNFITQAYPIVISWTDILLTMVGVAVIGYLIAMLCPYTCKQFCKKRD